MNTRPECLERAASLAARGEWAEVLGQLREAWRDGKHPRIAEAAWRTLRTHLRPDPVSERLERETEEAWLTMANSASPLPRLLSTAWPRQVSAAKARLRALVALSPDPLISAAFAEFARTDPYRSQQSLGMIRSMLMQLSKWHDPLCAVMIRELRAKERSPFQVNLGRAERAPESMPPALSEAELAALERTERLLGPAAGNDLAALTKQVLEHPESDAPRAVLADALSELGDPRGELITLQLAEHGRQRPSRRVTDLLRMHAATWLGELEPLIERPMMSWAEVFERGFPTRVRLKPEMPAEVLTRTERWATIEDLRLLHGFRFEPPYPFLRALRRLEGLTNRPTHPLPALEEVVLHTGLVPNARLSTVSQLSLLGFRAGMLEQLVSQCSRSPWFSSVRCLGIGGGLSALGSAQALLARLPTLESVLCASALGETQYTYAQGGRLAPLGRAPSPACGTVTMREPRGPGPSRARSPQTECAP